MSIASLIEHRNHVEFNTSFVCTVQNNGWRNHQFFIYVLNSYIMILRQDCSEIFFYSQAIPFNAPDFIIRSLQIFKLPDNCCSLYVWLSVVKKKRALTKQREIESGLGVKLLRKKTCHVASNCAAAWLWI